MRVLLALALVLSLAGCKHVARSKIDAALWLNNGMDPELCGAAEATTQYPTLWLYGFYRKLNTGKIEFISFCDPKAKDWLAMHKDDFNRLMDQAGLPKVADPGAN